MTKVTFGNVEVEVRRSIADTGSRVVMNVVDVDDLANGISVDMDPKDVHILCRVLVSCAWEIIKDKMGPIMTWVKALGVDDD